MALKLYTYPGNFRAFKALIAAEYQGIDIEVPDFDVDASAKTPEFLAMSPMGKVPVLSTPQGAIFESNAIARYVARLRRDTDLYGRTFFESAVVDSWVDFCAHELELPCTMWVYPIIGYMPFNALAHAKAVEHVEAALATLDAHLQDKTFIVGDSVTLADIAIVSALVYPAKFALDGAFRAKFANVFRWFDLCVHQPQFVAVIGDVPLATSELPPAGASAAPAKAAPKAAPKADKPKEEKKPKAEKAPKAAAAPAGPAPITDEYVEKKAVHPYKIMDKDLPSTMDGDEWKRTFSNNPPEVSMPKFWEMFDEKGWSLWTSRFKYNGENEKQFMAANAVGGFLQRSSEVRKWAFGAMFVTGSEECMPIEISGLWLVRGHSIEHLIECNDDAICYDWKKMDAPVTDELKALVYEYWTADVDGYLEGKLVTDGKIFK
mmetsp:Transcript_22239/g.77064  ORF Transcript_22239/g.77064 Transcript_22239/m.77064 type:complete len:433 (+) Transcript_22239:46-1344(+)